MSFRDDFLGYSNHRIEPVETPAGPTFVRSMSAGDKDKLEIDFGKDSKYRCRIVMLSCCDAEGHLEFSQKDMMRIDAMPLHVVEPIVDAAMKLNGFTAREREEMRKNSPARDDGSSIDSP